MSNVIKVRNFSQVVDEAVANAAIKPGSFVTLTNTGTVGPADADFDGTKVVADLDGFQGKTKDDDYASGDQVQLWTPYPGDIVNAVAGAVIVAGALLSIAADGKVVTATTGPIIGEAVTPAAADGNRVQVRIK